MLQVCYFESFKGSPTLLIAGGQSEIRLLREFIDRWGGDRLDVLQLLGRSTELYSRGMRSLWLERSTAVAGSVVNIFAEVCEWKISEAAQVRIVALLQGLADHSGAAHQYLDIGSSEIQVLCSKDEYPEPLVAS